MELKLSEAIISISLTGKEGLVQLGNILDWKILENLVLKDLKKTEKKSWHLGRALMLRIHLAVYILQALFNKTDRGIEADLKQNALFQLFCGHGIVDRWRIPDHTCIEKFRNRLSPETHHAISEFVIKAAHKAGFANPAWMDVDSTVQEANISYPSDASLMTKLTAKAVKVAKYLTQCGEKISVNLKKVRGKMKEYFFMSKNTLKEKKRKVFAELHQLVVEEVVPVIKKGMDISEREFQTLPSRMKSLFHHVCELGIELLADVESFIKTSKIVPTKILSFHAQLVACINKGKAGKTYEFGRTFQLGRIGGNFLFIKKADSIRDEDKSAIPSMIKQHERLFGKGILESVATDKGYYSKKNINSLKRACIKEIGIQTPKHAKIKIPFQSQEEKDRLRDRRAGIEPLIGHLKQRGFGKSRMKSDTATENSAYRCVMGWNCHQMIRNLEGRVQVR